MEFGFVNGANFAPQAATAAKRWRHNCVNTLGLQWRGTRARAATRISLQASGEDDKSVEFIAGKVGTRIKEGFLTWRGHRTYYQVAGKEGDPPAALIHGFGAGTISWRNTIGALSEQGFRVYALDLVGFGQSDKPLEVKYELELWRDQVADFITEFGRLHTGHRQARDWLLCGNSVGSLVALMTAQELRERSMVGYDDSVKSASHIPQTRAIAMFNCAGGLTSFRYEELAPPLAALLWVFKSVLFNDIIGGAFFSRFRTKANIRAVLEKQVYCNMEAVDDELVDALHTPSEHPNACAVFLRIMNAPAGPTPRSIIHKLNGNVRLLAIWGAKDPWTPLRHGIHRGELYPEWGVELKVIDDAGHCPQDDRPTAANAYLLDWISRDATDQAEFWSKPRA